MKELTTNDKRSLVSLLEKYYVIEEKNFIDAIASNEEERLNLTLKAYAMQPKYINTPTNVPTNTQVVVINKMQSKLRFVKAIKEVMKENMSLREAKDLADQLLTFKEGEFGECYSEPFIIGDSMDSKFTKKQWAEICECLAGDMIWKYV